MRSLLILAAFAATTLFATGCTSTSTSPTATVVASVGCALEGSVVNTAAVLLAQGLQCSNQAAIVTSITAAASSLKICSTPTALAIGKPKAPPVIGADGKPVLPLKSVGSTICTSLADTLIASLPGGVIPTAWGCAPTSAVASVTGLVNQACNAIP